MKRLSFLFVLMLAIVGCNEDIKKEAVNNEVKKEVKKPAVRKEFGFVLNDYEVVEDTIESGDSFGYILDQNGVSRGQVYEIAQKVKDTFNPARIVAGKKYVILKAKDSARTPKYFIYQENKIDYTVVSLS